MSEDSKKIQTAKRCVAVTLLCFALFSLSVCSLTDCAVVENKSNTSDVFCLNELNSNYFEVLAQALPGYSLSKTPRVYPTLQQKNTIATEAFDPQALPALEYGVAAYWYPHYLATVVLALDRDMTEAEIFGWSELISANEAVGFIGTLEYQMIFSSIAYGVEGDNYSLHGAARILANLRKRDLLRPNSSETAITICYDFQAADMKKNGRNIEIVVPREGTFSFERGLLSKAELTFKDDLDPSLISAGFRLIDGSCDSGLYPDAAAYQSAAMVSDYTRFNTISLDGDRIFRRDILNTRMYTSADGREHQLFPLIYMIILIAWAALVYRRAMQKSVRRAVLLTEIILLGWMIVRLIKFQIVDESTLGLYLWYSYDLFKLTLPLVILWMSQTIDSPEEKRFPKWMLAPIALVVILICLIFTTHIHRIIYQLDFDKLNWASNYSYGQGYVVIHFACYGPLVAAFVIMMVKCGRSSLKKSFVFPAVFLAVLMMYGYGYFARIPIARESDITMVTGLLTLLAFESALRTGLIPVNTRYRDFFENTTLGMQIISNDKKTMMSSAAAVEYGGNVIAGVLALSPIPVSADENTLLFASGIRGGNVFWREDIAGLNRLHAEFDESVRRLSAANALLAEEEKVKRIIAEENEKEQLMRQLEAEIAEHTAKLSVMVQQIADEDGRHSKAVELALLLCYIKRRSNFFFREQEAQTMRAAELTGYLDELAGIAAYSDKMIAVSNDADVVLTIRSAALFYDLFYSVIEWAALQSCPHVMAHLREKNETVILRLLPYSNCSGFAPETKLLEAIRLCGGEFSIENLDDAATISLSFPQGGIADV